MEDSTRKQRVLQWLRRWKPYHTRREIRQTLIAVAVALFCSYVHGIAISLADRLNRRTTSPSQILVDPWMYLVPWTGSPEISDTLAGVASFLSVVGCFTIQRDSLRLCRQAMVTMGGVFLIRSAAIVFTILPNPLLNCSSTPHPNLLWDALLLSFRARVSCGDVWFSGHTMVFTVCALVWATGTHSYVLKVPVVLLCFFGMLSLSFTMYHYSIDILAGFAVTIVVWHLYSWGARVPGMQQKWWAHGFVALDKVDFAAGEVDTLVPQPAAPHRPRVTRDPLLPVAQSAKGRERSD